MVRQVNVTGAESCWDDGFEDDSSCEKYLQQKKAELIAETPVEEDEYEEETADEDDAESSEDEVKEIHNSAADDADDEESDVSEETADADEEPAAAEVAKGAKMVKAKTTAGKMTKADAIRAIIAAKQEAGVEIRPRDIKAALEKKGIDVNASQISITLRAMGVPPTTSGRGRPAGSGGKVPAAHSEEPKSRVTARFKALPDAEDGDGQEASLNHAADLLRAAGSYEAAVSALNLCRKLIARN